MKIKNPQKLLNDIEAFRSDLNAEGIKLSPNLAGIYGEILAWKKLNEIFSPEGFEVDFGSGQSKADIQLIKGRQTINVEIKTSRLKKEWFGEGYGFAINIKKCKAHPNASFAHQHRGALLGDFCYFDYLIAVSLLDDLSRYNFYIFPKSFLLKHEKELRNKNLRFNSSTHRIIFAVKPEKTKELTSFDKKLMKENKKYKNAWSLIRS